MVELGTVGFGIAGAVLGFGMLWFSIRVFDLFKGGSLARAWLGFAVSSGILVVISLAAVAQSFEWLSLPSWWREGSALIFRLSLVYALYIAYRTWKHLGPK